MKEGKALCNTQPSMNKGRLTVFVRNDVGVGLVLGGAALCGQDGGVVRGDEYSSVAQGVVHVQRLQLDGGAASRLASPVKGCRDAQGDQQ